MAALMYNNCAYTHLFGKWGSVNCHLFQLLKAFKIHFYLLCIVLYWLVFGYIFISIFICIRGQRQRPEEDANVIANYLSMIQMYLIFAYVLSKKLTWNRPELTWSELDLE